MSEKSVLISLYPLTERDLQNVSRHTGKLEQVVLSNIVAKNYSGIYRTLRKLDVEKIYFPVFDQRTHALIPLYQLIGILLFPKRAFLIDLGHSPLPITFIKGAQGSAKLLLGAIQNTIRVISCSFQLLLLLRARRVEAFAQKSNSILYLKQTLWIGLKFGGAIAHSRGVVQGLLHHGWKVDTLSFDSAMENTTVNQLTTASNTLYAVPRGLNFGQYNRQVFESLLQKPFDRYLAIYQRLSQGSFSGVLLSRQYKIPLIIEYNGSETWLATNWGMGLSLSRFVGMAEQACLRHAHLVVTVSDVLREELIERGISPHRVVCVPNGADTDEFNPARYSGSEIHEIRSRLDIGNDALLFTFVGTFGPWHGADFLAKTMVDFTKGQPEFFEKNNIYICFIGDGVKRHVVEEHIEESPLAHRFILTGLIPQNMSPMYMAASDVLISPHVPNPDGSAFFGSPTKLFEYMAAGKPIIASGLDQINTILDGSMQADHLPETGTSPTGEACGILVKPQSQPELIQAVQFLAENPEWRRLAGDNARKRVISRYTWHNHTKQIMSGLANVLKTKDRSRPPVKILINALHAKTGGGVTYIRNILPLISNSPVFEIHICLHRNQIDLLSRIDSRVHIHTLDFKDGFWRLPLWEQILVPKLARKIGVDVTFSPANYGPIFAPNSVILLRNALGVAFVEKRPAKVMYWLLVSLGTFASMIACRRAIAVSQFARQSNFGPISGFIRKRLSIIYHGVSKAYSNRDKTTKRGDFILSVSDIYVQKNLENLILAVSVLKAHRPEIRLVIAGRPVDRNYYLNLKRVIAEHQLEKNIEFLGEVSEKDLVELYSQCALFVFPSTVETFGNPLVEAMACGAPIATSSTAAMPEIADNAALYFDPKNIDGIASCMERLITDKELCRELSQNALKRSEFFSWERTADLTLDILSQAASRNAQ